LSFESEKNNILLSNKLETDILMRFALSTNLFSKNNDLYLRNHFKITKKHLDSIHSKNALEDVLIEKAAILV